MAYSRADITWKCPTCKKQHTVKIDGDALDPFDVMLTIKTDHEEVSPECGQDVGKIILINPPDFKHDVA